MTSLLRIVMALLFVVVLPWPAHAADAVPGVGPRSSYYSYDGPAATTTPAPKLRAATHAAGPTVVDVTRSATPLISRGRARKVGVDVIQEAGPALRTDIQLSGGRGGGAVKTLTGPPNSIVRGAPGRVYQTDSEGRVIADITAGRVKPVTPGRGFGPKRPPTPQEREWLIGAGG